MADQPSKAGYVVSGALHAGLLAAIVFGFTSAPNFQDTQESIPVETISQTDFNQIMRGERDAPPAKEPAKEVLKPTLAEPPPAPLPPAPPPRPVEEAVAVPPPAPVKSEPPPPKPEPTAPEPPARPKVAETPTPTPSPKPLPTPKPDALAKLIETPTPTPTHSVKPFDPNAIARALSTPKATPDPVATAASAPAQGLAHHDAPRMALSMKVALDNWFQDAYRACWLPPPTPPGEKYIALIKVEFNADGALVGQPTLANPPSDPAWRAYADSARHAVLKCNPLHVPQQYLPFFDEWRTKTVHFDPDTELG